MNVRIIAATNKSLLALCREGAFREYIYYRISVFPIDVPPLRERREDIATLSNWILRRMSIKLNRNFDGFTPDAEEALVAYSWPGNIRELRNCIERAVIVERGSRIGRESLFLNPTKILPMKFDEIGLMPLKVLEHSCIAWALDELEGNKTSTAEALGISPRGLYDKLHR